MADRTDELARREAPVLARSSPAELRAAATRALAEGDEYSRALLREQLEREERLVVVTPNRSIED